MTYVRCPYGCPACDTRPDVKDDLPGDEIRSFVCNALGSADDAGPRHCDAKPAIEELESLLWVINNGAPPTKAGLK